MVSFVSVKHLKPGMVLERDIYGIDKSTKNVVMLRSGQELTHNVIPKIKSLSLKGLYIHDDNKFDKEHQIVKTKLKEEVLDNIKEIYNLSEKATQGLYSGTISHANDVLNKLVDTIITNENMYVDLSSLRMYDDCTYNHSLGVTVLSIAIGKRLGLARKHLSELALCAILHDIGKMQVPHSIITKPGRLTADEFEQIKEHPLRGSHILKENELVTENVRNGVISHHEKFDGTGYPYKLKGKSIPLFGRIITVADVYDALTSNRPYRTPATPGEAIEYIMGSTNRQFDNGVVRAFLKCISPYPVGSCVNLSNGETAVIVDQNSNNPMRPKIFMMNDPNNVIDLSLDTNYLDIVIESISQ